MPGFDLRPDVELRDPRHVCSRPRIHPRGGLHSVPDRDLHQAMIAGMKLDFVDPFAVAVVGAQYRREAVRIEAPADRLCAAGLVADFVEGIDRPRRALAQQAALQRRIRGVQVVVDGGNLVRVARLLLGRHDEVMHGFDDRLDREGAEDVCDLREQHGFIALKACSDSQMSCTRSFPSAP